MGLKENLDLEAFFASIRRCNGEVILRTAENDVLNLKSALCLFVFTQAYLIGHTRIHGELVCEDPNDVPLLAEYLEEEYG